ncbi:4'-phosphopantetheinyl transferase superfamily protein [Streptomyces platensis]|uniref:4'-phosphopantetheinyl transferase superfamily protein n=1 Tax=Streptomyces platensis TaxID=58346 RepID=UPI0037BCB0B1
MTVVSAGDRARAGRQLLALGPLLAASGLALGTALAKESAARPAGPGEARLAAAMPPVRRRDFLAGRCAARRALGAAGLPVGEIPRDGRRPVLPDGHPGSISHSGGLAVAVVAARQRCRALGCDLELRGLPPEAARLVLRADERRRVMDGAASPEGAAYRVLAAFSAKEAAFKACAALLPASDAPACLLDLTVRRVPGGFLARPAGVPGCPPLEVRVHPVGPGVFSWAAVRARPT